MKKAKKATYLGVVIAIAVMMCIPVGALSPFVTVKNKDMTDETVIEQPITTSLDIAYIGGGLGVWAVIRNSGDAPELYVYWRIRIDATIMIQGSYEAGVISTILPDRSVTIRLSGVLGLGPATISVGIGHSGNIEKERSVPGFVIGPFVVVYIH